ncbi:AAA family ATPase [Pseudomonas sp. N040]|nr:AAA family ATPase [Pseudomonas sp. N040]MBW7015039.1 AAA family ATPase [Pseudomonas sp. N040]
MALQRLWLDRDNGVSSLKQGVLSRAELSAQQVTITELTQGILASPTGQTHEQVMQRWRQGVESGQFKMNRPAMINRVFAAIAPDQFTSLLKTEDCQLLLRGLAAQFQLPVTSLDEGWCGLNAQIIRCMDMAGLDMNTVLPNNIAMWQLLEALQGGPGVDPVELPDTTIPLNQILFGPPGTGKTYATIDRALKILDPALVAKPDVQREELTTAFKRYIENGQVVFCTFHQSFSYEDFVEGLRAETLDGALHYRVESGLFKKLCERASLGRPAVDDPFDQALKVLSEQLEANDGRLTLSTSKGKIFEVEYAGGLTFLVFPKSNEELKNGYTGNMELVRKLYQTGSKEGIYNSSYVDGMLGYLRKECGLPEYQPSAIPASQRDKFVLIIDEINRGSVSRIFGELITLIEPSKRAGQLEALEVMLPYSKKPFSVPANLYLLGTMNTADRSLAGLDIALRRRFTFVEMPPRPDLLDEIVIEGVNIGQLLGVMNQRIEVLLDRDHCLGHAYFIPLKTDPSLELLGAIFRNQIMPLLQEYFFEDWERIAWVLNDQRAKDNASVPFLRRPESEQNVAALFGNEVAGKLNDQRWALNDAAFVSIDSYRNILG